MIWGRKEEEETRTGGSFLTVYTRGRNVMGEGGQRRGVRGEDVKGKKGRREAWREGKKGGM